MAEELQGLFHRHLQDLRNIRPLVPDLQRLTVEALPLALIARHVDVGKKVHFYANNTLPLTGLAPPPLDIKAEPPLGVSPDLGFRELSKEVPNESKNPRIRCRI